MSNCPHSMLNSNRRAGGVSNIETRYYKEGRHELLNEIERDEVTRDITLADFRKPRASYV